MEPLAVQFQSLFVSVLAGIFLSVLFDVYRVIRCGLRPKRGVELLLDLLFWLLVAPLLMGQFLLVNWGQLRLYVFVGLALGFIFCRLIVSPSLVALLFWCLGGSARLLNGLLLLLAQAMVLPFNVGQDIYLRCKFSRRRCSRLRWKPLFIPFRRR